MLFNAKLKSVVRVTGNLEQETNNIDRVAVSTVKAFDGN